MASNLTLVGTPTFTSAATGFGQALTLNGTTQWAAVASGTPMVFAGGASFTVRGRFLTSSNTAAQAVASCVNGSTPSWVITVQSGFPAFNAHGFNGNNDVVSSTVTVDDGAWHDFELVINNAGSTAKLYIDGVAPADLSTTGTYAPVTGGADRQTWGAYDDSGAPQIPWVGKLDDFGIFNTALHTSNFTPATTPTSNNASNLVALWHCDNGQVSGTTLLDCAGATFTVSPTSGGASQALTFTGTGTQWTTKNPDFSIDGSGNAIGATTPTTATAATASVSTVGTAGAFTITDNSSGFTQSFTTTGAVATAELSGPTFGLDGVASTNFTVTISSPASGDTDVTLSDGAASGTFTPSTPTILNGETEVNFTYTPSGPGIRTITATVDGGVDPVEAKYTAYNASKLTFASIAPYGPSYPDMEATIGFTVYDSVGVLVLDRTLGYTSECGTDTGIYVGEIPIERNSRGVIVWDAPAGATPFVQAFNPSGGSGINGSEILGMY